MGLLRAVMILEAALLAGCGFVCLAFPDVIGAALNQIVSADIYTRRALGIALIALAIPLIQMSMEVGKFNHLMISYCLLPAVSLAAIGIAAAQHGLNGPPLFWRSVAGVLAVLTMILLLTRARVARGSSLDDLPFVIALDPLHPKAGAILQLHEARMKYAWDWFQYHADQRLKGFNFFVVAIGVLVAAFGAAMKESFANASRAESYLWFAVGIAVCGTVISIAFLLIEVRNVELVECGRRWLDSLEGGLGMKLREDDEKRRCLPKAVGILTGGVTPPELIISHMFWFRVIYGLAAIGFVFAFFFALRGFS